MTLDHTLEQDREDRGRSQNLSLTRDHPPTTVPGYEPERFLGAGAFGEVWTATNRNTGRRVAIKFYAHRGGLDWSLLSREVEKLRFLFADRYAVQLLDVGWDADPPYYVMEYMAQGALEERTKQGPLPVHEALRLFREVATGLLHAHGKGILHCDLKPANVLLDHDGNPRLADFGQSRLSHDQTPSLGTLFYMAPEQADLRAVPHARWDVYALGALLYTMLVGHAPYRTADVETALSTAGELEERLQTYRRMLQQSPPPREHRKVPGVDRSLAEIIERCLAVDPDKRFANVQAVLDALNLRGMRRAQRPLLVLGAGVPVLLLTVIWLFASNAIRAAIDQSQAAVIEKALHSNRFAAQFVAETVARQIDRRWQIIEQQAAQEDFTELLREAQDQPIEAPARRALQDALTRLAVRHPEVRATSWFVTDRKGIQIARYPADKVTLDRDFSYRDYFHGQGQDLPPGTPNLKPLERTYRSNVFRSVATNNRMVAFSTCVWSGPKETPDRHVLGVIAMTIELGRFAELSPEDTANEGQVAVLVDARKDAAGRRGAILEHPYLAAYLRGNFGPTPELYLTDDEIARIEELRPLKLALIAANQRADEAVKARSFSNLAAADTPEGTLTESVGKSGQEAESSASDAPANTIAPAPVGLPQQVSVDPKLVEKVRRLALRPTYYDSVGGTYQGVWLAAVEPVIVDERAEEMRDTGWAVIVQERQQAATRPIATLGPRLRRLGLTALGVVGVLVTLLWGFAIILLDDAPQSRWIGKLRRTIGLGSLRTGSASTLGSGSMTPGTGADPSPASQS
ncbi:MAG: serine/threonine protein kinase [Pirellulales bacterium]|nr:serine/threonine protein kinase [Pirellulales bacterium]